MTELLTGLKHLFGSHGRGGGRAVAGARGGTFHPCLEELDARLTPSASPALSISGGGMATFDAKPGGTIFSVEAHIDAGGHVKGHFMCAIPGAVVVIGDDLTSATVNADGSVTLMGMAHGRDAAGGVFKGMRFAVKLLPGGPGAGKFIYDDPFVASSAVDVAEGDHETVSSGHIMFHRR